MYKKITPVIIILFAALLLAACGRQSCANPETGDYVLVEDVEAEEMEDTALMPEGIKEEQNEPSLVVSDNMPAEAVELILRHFEAIENSDKQTLVSTFGIDDSSNFVLRHHIDWLADELIRRYSGTGLSVVSIEGFWEKYFYVHVHIRSNLNSDAEKLAFSLENSGDVTHPWHIIRYDDDFRYYETLGFVNFEGILVDNRISAVETSLIHSITNFFDALEQGNAKGFIENHTGLAFNEFNFHFLDYFKGAGSSVEKIEIVNHYHTFWYPNAIMTSVTVSHETYGLHTIFKIAFESFQRLAGEQMWGLSSSPYLGVNIIIDGVQHYASFDTNSMYDWMLLNFMVSHYPAYFLDHSIIRGVSDFHHYNRGLSLPIPKGVNYFASVDELVEPSDFRLYRIPDSAGEADVIIAVVTFSSFWYWGERVYGFYNGEFALINENSRLRINFWTGGSTSIPFVSLRTNEHYNFYSFEMDELRETNVLWRRSIRRQVRRDFVHEEPRREGLTNMIGVHNIERLEPIAVGWTWGDHATDTFPHTAIRRNAVHRSIEHLTHPGDRLMLALMGNSSAVSGANRIAVFPAVNDYGEYGEWILINDNNLRAYKFCPNNTQLLNPIGALPNVGGYIHWMDLEEESSVTLVDVMLFIRSMRLRPIK